MPTIREVLDEKGREVVTVDPDRTVSDVISVLVDRRIGCVLVREEAGDVIGIITERDILRIVRDDPGRIGEAKVSEFMTRDVVCAVPEDDLDYAMNIMTENRLRRMPVMDGDELVGLISIGDVVKALKSARDYEVRMLRNYIAAM
jgi:CBS domain-containing protein